MVFNIDKIKTTMQQIGQKLTLDKIHQFGTRVRETALQIGRKVSNTAGKISVVGTKLLPMAETAATAMGYVPEPLGIEGANKGLDMANNTKNTVDSLRNQGRAFRAGGIPLVIIFLSIYQNQELMRSLIQWIVFTI